MWLKWNSNQLIGNRYSRSNRLTLACFELAAFGVVFGAAELGGVDLGVAAAADPFLTLALGAGGGDAMVMTVSFAEIDEHDESR